jgi:hypothetical protein
LLGVAIAADDFIDLKLELLRPEVVSCVYNRINELHETGGLLATLQH